MKNIKLSDINIYDIGNSIQMCGTVWSGKGITFITQFPQKDEDFSDLTKLSMDLSDWEKFLKQTDILETEIFEQDPTGKIVKTIVRKTQRQIDSYVQWECFRRDNYTCRYCGRTGIPLTVDHIDLWEDGGATHPINLISACRSCNKDRGRLKYSDWLGSSIYKRKSANLTMEQKLNNLSILGKLKEIEDMRVKNKRSR